MRSLLAAMTVALAVASAPVCAAGAEIIQLSPGVYMSIVKNRAGVFGQPSTTKKKAILAANKFAEEKGMAAVPVAMEFHDGAPGRWPAAEYQFRLVPIGQEATVGLQDAPDTRIEVTSTTTTAPQPADLYTELTKLDDLRKRGIITDDEFETQKAKLLSR